MNVHSSRKEDVRKRLAAPFAGLVIGVLVLGLVIGAIAGSIVLGATRVSSEELSARIETARIDAVDDALRLKAAYDAENKDKLENMNASDIDAEENVVNCDAVVIRDGVATYQFDLAGSCTSDSLFVNGTYYADGQMFVTWCSTEIFKHYLMNTWTKTDDGLYIDEQGYLAVGASFGNIGDIIEGTPFGDARIYDVCPSYYDKEKDKTVAEVVYFVSWNK